jgi:hypothetical protein
VEFSVATISTSTSARNAELFIVTSAEVKGAPIVDQRKEKKLENVGKRINQSD